MIDEEQHFQIDPLTAPFVLDVFKKYDKGATMKELRDWLNENGVRNKLGKPLNFNSIQHMLSNRRYIGEYKYRDIIVPDGIPAIVPQDLFDRVQEKLAQNRKAPARHKAEDDYLLTTKLFCGYCGAYLFRCLLAPQIPQAGCASTVPPQNADRHLCERHLPVR